MNVVRVPGKMLEFDPQDRARKCGCGANGNAVDFTIEGGMS